VASVVSRVRTGYCGVVRRDTALKAGEHDAPYLAVEFGLRAFGPADWDLQFALCSRAGSYLNW